MSWSLYLGLGLVLGDELDVKSFRPKKFGETYSLSTIHQVSHSFKLLRSLKALKL
jgi:hypothetical protein